MPGEGALRRTCRIADHPLGNTVWVTGWPVWDLCSICSGKQRVAARSGSARRLMVNDSATAPAVDSLGAIARGAR
jgi:uncharacterized cupin superfamily protein